MDLTITPEKIAQFRDKDSRKAHFRELYEKHDFITAYAKHTDIRVKENPKGAIGREDEWETHGEMQLEFLKSEGMKPHHRLLDVGCGVGRAARKFVPYLNAGNYAGVDISEGALAHARELSVSEGWADKAPLFALNADLDLVAEFNFIWAHSVFTHLPPQQIQRMIQNAAALLPAGGRFCFTYKPAPKSYRSGLKQYQHPVSFFESCAKPQGFKCEPLSLMWPAHQRTIRLTKQ